MSGVNGGRRAGAFRAAAWLLLLLPAALACRARDTFPKAPVVIVSIDTLRADHLPAYGYARVETPALDALRRDSILFESAYSHVPLTLPSHAAILTGLLPPQNGVRDNVGYFLASDHATLAELLRKAGYGTGAAVSAVVLAKTSGVGRGFDFYEDSVEATAPGQSLGAIQRSGAETEALAERWIEENGSSPFFFFLHLYEPHTPYAPPEPYASRYRDRPYDGEIAAADAVVGRFVSFLKERGLYERAVVIFLSDHGEGLGDHGEEEHGLLLYREDLRVPVFLKLPGNRRAGEKVARPVGLIDVLPTVAALVGVQPPAGLPGTSLVFSAASGAARSIYSETLFPRYHFGFSDLAALTTDRYAYIHAPRPELYDIVADPAQKRDLAAGMPQPFRALRAELERMNRPRQAPGTSDPEQVRKLAALGYIGQTSPSETATDLPDPKDHVEEIRQLRAALTLQSERRHAEAAEALRRLLAINPAMADAWGALAESERRLGRLAQSFEALEREDRLVPGNPHVLLSFANQYLEAGDDEKARLYAERALAANAPPEAHEVLARIAMARRDWDGAEREAKLALEGHQGRKLPRLILSQVLRARGDLNGALAMLDQVAEELARSGRGEMSSLHFFRGDILARMGRNAEAEAEFRKELSIFPDSIPPWSGLALLQASRGDLAGAHETIAAMVRAIPSARSYRAAAEILRVLGDPAAAREMERRGARPLEPAADRTAGGAARPGA